MQRSNSVNFQPRLPSEAIIKRDWLAGLTIREMAERYGVTTDAVRKYLSRREENWASNPISAAGNDSRKVVVQMAIIEAGVPRVGFVSLPRISMHVAALRERGVNV